MNQPGIAMEVEYDRLVFGKQGIEVAVRQAVTVFRLWLEPVEIDNVHEADLQVGKMLTKNSDRPTDLSFPWTQGAGM
jgi:hypothetical protein